MWEKNILHKNFVGAIILGRSLENQTFILTKFPNIICSHYTFKRWAYIKISKTQKYIQCYLVYL